MSMKKMLDNRSTGEAGEMINSSDIPAETKTVNIVVAALRASPEEFNAPAIIDLKTPVFGKSTWPVNKSNLKALIRLFGEDEAKLVGKRIKLQVIMVRNPQTGEVVPSLAVTAKQ
jgi:hypothetical protein